MHDSVVAYRKLRPAAGRGDAAFGRQPVDLFEGENVCAYFVFRDVFVYFPVYFATLFADE